MMGPSHRLLGALFGATYASLAGAGTPVLVASTIVSTTMAYGMSSPDMDQAGAWKKFSTATGLGKLLGHRHLTHWWGLPLAAVFPILALDPGQRWVFWSLLLGWVSHLAGDFAFGKLPLMPWGGAWLGVGLDTDGILESGVGPLRFSLLRTLIVTALVAVIWLRPVLPPLPELPGWVPFAG